MLILVFAAGLTSAQDVTIDGLDFEEVEADFQEENISFNNSYMSQELSPENVFVPDELREPLIDEEFQYDLVSWDGWEDGEVVSEEAVLTVGWQFENAPDIEYEYPNENVSLLLGNDWTVDDGDYPQHFYSHYETTEASVNSSDEARVFDFDLVDDSEEDYNVSWNIDVSSHYEHLIINYDLVYEEEGDDSIVIESFEDVYSSDRPEKVNFEIKEEQINNTHSSQVLSQDNKYRSEYSRIVQFVHERDVSIEDINTEGVVDLEEVEKDYSEDIRPELEDSGISEELILSDEQHSEYSVSTYEATMGEDSIVEMEAVFEHPERITEEDGVSTLDSNYTYYGYLVGSGGSYTVDSSEEFCGEEEFGVLNIEATAEICSVGVEFDVEEFNLKSSGDINHGFNEGPDVDITSSGDVLLDGKVDLSSDSNVDDDEPSGGDLTITASGDISGENGEIDIQARQTDDDNEGGDGGDLTIEAGDITLDNYIIDSSGGPGDINFFDSCRESGDGGSISFIGDSVDIDADIDTRSPEVSCGNERGPFKGQDGGDIFIDGFAVETSGSAFMRGMSYENYDDSRDTTQGGDGGDFKVKSETNITNSMEVESEGGDSLSGSGGSTECHVGGDGGDFSFNGSEVTNGASINLDSGSNYETRGCDSSDFPERGLAEILFTIDEDVDENDFTARDVIFTQLNQLPVIEDFEELNNPNFGEDAQVRFDAFDPDGEPLDNIEYDIIEDGEVVVDSASPSDLSGDTWESQGFEINEFNSDYSVEVRATDDVLETTTETSDTFTELSLERPDVSVNSPLEVGSVEATLDGDVPSYGDFADGDLNYFYRYRETGETEWQETSSVNFFESNDDFSKKVEDLDFDTEHEYKLVASWSDGEEASDLETFVTDNAVPFEESEDLEIVDEIFEAEEDLFINEGGNVSVNSTLAVENSNSTELPVETAGFYPDTVDVLGDTVQEVAGNSEGNITTVVETSVGSIDTTFLETIGNEPTSSFDTVEYSTVGHVDSNFTSQDDIIWKIDPDNLRKWSDRELGSEEFIIDGDESISTDVQVTGDGIWAVATNDESLEEGSYDFTFSYYYSQDSDGSSGGGGGGGTVIDDSDDEDEEVLETTIHVEDPNRGFQQDRGLINHDIGFGETSVKEVEVTNLDSEENQLEVRVPEDDGNMFCRYVQVEETIGSNSFSDRGVYNMPPSTETSTRFMSVRYSLPEREVLEAEGVNEFSCELETKAGIGEADSMVLEPDMGEGLLEGLGFPELDMELWGQEFCIEDDLEDQLENNGEECAGDSVEGPTASGVGFIALIGLMSVAAVFYRD